jgi:predicted O-linked N-acetylglucosamine transferase (SPINDLY family)
VPVVTLRGTSHAHNVSVSLLKAIGGLDHLIAQSDQQYVDIAVRTAQDIASLASLRQSLRARMLQSSLCDGPNFVAAFQSALASMWSNHVNMNV